MNINKEGIEQELMQLNNSNVLKYRRKEGLTEVARLKLAKQEDVLMIDGMLYRLIEKAGNFWPCDDISAECKGFFDSGTQMRYMVHTEKL
jgi:hypothetical protein